MGRAIQSLEDDSFSIVGGVDVSEAKQIAPVFKTVQDINVDFDVVIDVSVPKASMAMLEYCVTNRKPIVICTTGFSSAEEQKILEAAELIPVFRSANMSLGINIQAEICKAIAKTLGGAADIEIIEKHHKRKLDAPSGTALMLFDELNEARNGQLRAEFGRDRSHGRREENEVGVHAVRGGSVVGEHEILFLMDDEVISVTHQAFSRRVFATGAVKAAKFIASKPAGFYAMKDLIAESR